MSSVDAQIKSNQKETTCILQDLVVVARVGVHRFLCVGVSDPAINDLHGSDRVLIFLSNELLAAKTPLILELRNAGWMIDQVHSPCMVCPYPE